MLFRSINLFFQTTTITTLTKENFMPLSIRTNAPAFRCVLSNKTQSSFLSLSKNFNWTKAFCFADGASEMAFGQNLTDQEF